METIKDDEKVVRLLHRDWVVDGVLQVNAFALRRDETYISVNRPVVDSFTEDVSDFISTHREYLISDESTVYKQAVLIAGDVRYITIELGHSVAKVSVEIEPRSKNYPSHAGIFTRYGDKNLKGGIQDEISIGGTKHIPVPAILQKVQHRLLRLSTLETHELTKG